MAKSTAQDVYQLVKQLPAAERLRLVERIVHELSAVSADELGDERFDWRQLAGVAPGLTGEDPQGWVSRTRREADEHRQVGSRGDGGS